MDTDTEPTATLQLVAGLGNPGPRYEPTRHNAGFWFVEELARRYGGHFREESKFQGELCRVEVNEQPVWLFKPMAFMNRSGSPLMRLMTFYKIPLSAVLVVHDELDLPPGTVRIKRSGGPGGHNGLRDIIAQLGGGQFLRLRLGIGHPGDSHAVVDYVLRTAPMQEQRLLEQAITDAAEEFPRLLSGHLEKVMHTLHSRQVS
ncbi:MAG: aminoacyl-tRNA hydrolase [Candidatus Competibacteraceae bacterium]|nr:aminoacyl-tRNA hydrolase [Candidatus Competibacteraceae bacterium]